MKRYGEKATREALAQGATIRKYDDPMRGPVWRVRQDGEILGYITFDLYTKLYHDGSIERIDSGFMFTDYAATQEQPKSEDEENREYAQRIAQEVENYYRGHLRRCPCCEAIVERDDWDDLDVFRCPHCHDVDDVGQWEALTLHDYLEDVLDITYIVGSDRQTLEGARFYVTLGGPTVWVDTCSRAVELRWGGRSASWGLSFELCDELDEIAQEYWDMG